MIQREQIRSREQWLALRQADVTASDLGALFGHDPRKSPRQLYEEKKGLTDDRDNDVLRRGRWQEAAIVEMLAERHPEWRIERPNEYIRDPVLRLGATTDRIAIFPDGECVVIECKSVVRPVFDEEWGDDGPPIRVQLQALGNGMLRNVQRMLVAVLVRDRYSDEPHEFWIERHSAAEAKIVAGVRDFWRRIAESDPYPFDFARDKDLIAALHPKGGGPVVDLSQNNRIAFLCEEKLAWSQRRSACDKALDVIDAEITALLGDADRGEHPEFNISWKLQRRKETILPASEYRILRVTRKKEHRPTEEAA